MSYKGDIFVIYSALKENMRLAHSDEAIVSMQKELQTKLDTTKSGIERLTQAWRNLGSNLGETFLPLANLLASALGGIAGYAWRAKL